ncbi:SMI1/KNR4 family protein [Streptacidiphilus rugosus]|uniref:SMI1/KNR4 family protein n=1 Tax=Streptacidiphilus rugosus TaxID=405783 RepID=UPI0007C69C89|nr:SMI1/KNR4 family protein [Streptacidiphilus rugosus]
MTRFDDIKVTLFSAEHSDLAQSALTDEVVQEAEGILGVRLPAALVEILRWQNGGPVSSHWDAFPTAAPNSWSESHVPFEEVMGIGHRTDRLSLFDTPYLIGEWGLPSPIVLLCGDGHCWIALDYRDCGWDGEPTVTWFDTESNSELIVATDLRAFVEGLAPASRFDSESRPPTEDAHPPHASQDLS